jgi:DNA-binding LytR/AlgR family response regulator
MKNHTLTPFGYSVVVNYKQKIRIPVQNIIMLEGQSNYSIFHLKHGRQRIYAHTIRYFEAQLLAQQFIRVHRGFLVNPLFIIGYDKKKNALNLHNSLKVTISRRKLINLPNEFLAEQ